MILNYSAEIAFLVRTIALVICLLFVFPLMLRQVTVRDNLKKLRIYLLGLGTIIITVNFITMYYILDLILNDIAQKPINSMLQLINAVGHFLLALIIYAIYHSQYKENK
jgi:hypothetical protein